MDNLIPPNILIESNVVGLNESVRLDSLFIVTNADTLFQPITEYRIRDNTPDGGFFTQGGVALEPSFGGEIVIPANQIGSIRYVGGNSFGTNSISVTATDGFFTSNRATGFITSGNSRPVVTPNQSNFVVTAGSQTSIADFVTYSDAENNPDRLYLIVDRSFGFFGGQLITSQDNVANPQATFLLTTGAELAGTTYEAPSIGGESETLSIRAFDGFSWSELADFTVTSSIAPIVVDPGTQEVITGERRLASTLFSLDPTTESVLAAESFFFVDRRTNGGGGFFEFQGERQASGEFFFVEADQLDQLFYVGASNPNDVENIGIVAGNGLEFGDATDIEILTLPSPSVAVPNRTVQAGHFLNFATGGSANVGGTVPEGETPIFDFLDSGANVIEFLFADRSLNGGNFVFQGEQIPSAQFFRVPADQLDQLEYVGGQSGSLFSEDIGVLVNTNFVWSTLPDFTITTLPNANAPILTSPDITVEAGTVLPLDSLFSFTDADGDTLTSVTIFDTAADVVADPVAGIDAVSTGFFTINGVRQPDNTAITVPFDEIGTVNFVTSPTSGIDEDIQITVNDGFNNSETTTATIDTITLPTIIGDLNNPSIDTIQRITVSDLFSQTDGGPAPTRYQVFDENVDIRSGGFELDGVELQNGVVHDLTAAQFDRLVFVGAEVDLGRQLDPIIIRANDGTSFGEYERININTDPIGPRTLETGTQASDNVITFSFIDGGNQGGNFDEFGRAPFYYDPFLDDEGNLVGNSVNDADTPPQNSLVGLSQPQRETIREVFDIFERVADLEFVEVPYSRDTFAETVIGAYTFVPPEAGLSSIGFFPLGDSVLNPGSDFFYNRDSGDFDPNTPTDVSLGSEFRDASLALVAFSLGLGQPSGGIAPLSIFNNFTYLTVTSDQDDSVFNRFDEYPEQPSTVALYDVAQLQLLYGPNTDFNSGANQYGNFFSGSSPYFINNDEQHQTTLYDAGGQDALNYSLHVADETIDLRQGTFSTVNGVPQSLRISYETVIENARGGSGDDNIRGNEISNFLFGNDGDDVLRGGGDNDVLRGGTGNDTYVWTLGDGRDFVQEFNNGGVDTLAVFDASGSLSALEDDLTFRRFGNDLRIDFTFNQGGGQGTVTIDDFGDEGSRVELLTIHNAAGVQIGEAIDLQSIFEQSTTLSQQFAAGSQLATTIPVDDVLGDQNGVTALAIT